MKKIVAAVAAGLMLASAAFADVSFSYTGSAILGDVAKGFTKATRNDCLSLGLSNEVAGVVTDFDLNGGDKMELDQFYCWLTYALPVGSLQITSGKWYSRYVNRVKNLAGDLDAEFYEMAKPGVINGVIGKDSDNLTETKMASVLAWTLNDLPGSLMIKAGIVDSAYYTPSDPEETVMRAGFVGEVCYRQDDLVAINFAVKNLKIAEKSFAVFVSPLMIDGLNSMVGFTYACNDDDGEYGIDLRAKYGISEKTSITGMFNYSASKLLGTEEVKSMWNMLSLGYTAGDNIRYVATINNVVEDFDAPAGSGIVAFTPSCEIKASESCNVTCGFDMRWTGVKPFSSSATVRVPIYVSFSL